MSLPPPLAQRMRRLATDLRRGTGVTSAQRDAEHGGLPLAGFAATGRQRTGDPAVAVLHAQFAPTVLRERHRRLRNDRYTASGAVFATALAAVGGVERVAGVAGEGVDGKRLDVEIAFVPACGEAGRMVDSTLRVAAAVTERGQHGRRKLLAHGAIAGTGVERRTYFGEAAAMSADCNASGRALWRFAARRRMPAHAVELKKYRGGIEVVTSTCDNEHTLASLGETEILSVQYPPGDASCGSIDTTSVRPPRPWWFQRTCFPSQRAKKASKGVVPVGEHARDVFPHEDRSGLVARETDLVDGMGELHVVQGECAARIGQTLTATGDAEGLAGRAAYQDVGGVHRAGPDARRDAGHVAEVGHIGVVVIEHGVGERINLGKPRGFKAERLPGDAHGFDAAADAAIPQSKGVHGRGVLFKGKSHAHMRGR